MVTCPCFTPHPTSRLHVRGLYLILVPPLRAAQVTTYFHNPCATEKFTKTFFLFLLPVPTTPNPHPQRY
jgi:hypothetical protein